MSGYYPDGVTQADHDRAFDELGPSPAELAAEADAENDFDADYPDPPDEIPALEPITRRCAVSNIPEWEQFEKQPSTLTMAEVERDYISKRNARDICRVFMALERQILRAREERREDDVAALCRIIGATFYRALGSTCTELGQ